MTDDSLGYKCSTNTWADLYRPPYCCYDRASYGRPFCSYATLLSCDKTGGFQRGLLGWTDTVAGLPEGWGDSRDSRPRG